MQKPHCTAAGRERLLQGGAGPLRVPIRQPLYRDDLGVGPGARHEHDIASCPSSDVHARTRPGAPSFVPAAPRSPRKRQQRLLLRASSGSAAVDCGLYRPSNCGRGLVACRATGRPESPRARWPDAIRRKQSATGPELRQPVFSRPAFAIGSRPGRQPTASAHTPVGRLPEETLLPPGAQSGATLLRVCVALAHVSPSNVSTNRRVPDRLRRRKPAAPHAALVAPSAGADSRTISPAVARTAHAG